MKKKLIKRISSLSAYIGALLLMTTCYPGLGPAIDINAPRIGVSSHSNGAYVGGEITLSGYVEDDTEIESVTVTGTGIDLAATHSNTAWSVNLDTTPTGLNLADGEHEITISAKDSDGKEAEAAIFLIVDNGPPTVLLTSPTDYSTRTFNKVIAFKGEAVDTTRVNRILISLYDDADNPIFEDEVATGTSSWYYLYDASALPAGNYSLKVVAEDKALPANINDHFYHFYDLLSITGDPANVPSIEEVHGEDNEGSPINGGILTAGLDTIRKSVDLTIPLQFAIDPDSDAPQFTFVSPDFSPDPADNILSTPQRLSGFVDDDDGVKGSSLQIALWPHSGNIAEVVDLANPTVVPWTNITPSGNQWNFEPNPALSDGEYWMVLRVEDIYGDGTGADLVYSNQAAFRVSSFAPVVTVTSPAQGIYVGDGATVDLEVHVTGMGAGTVQVDPNGDNDFTDFIELTDPDTDGIFTGSVTEGANFTVPAGSNSFNVRAGSTGNWGTAALQYTRDAEAPTVSVDIPTNGADVNGTFNVLGASSDNSLVSAVYLWIEEDAVPGVNAITGLGLPAFDASNFLDWDSPDTTDVYNWAFNLDTTGLSDSSSPTGGDHTIHAVAIDAAGNTSAVLSRPFTVDQSTDNPMIYFTNLVKEGPALGNSLGQDAEFIGYIEEDDNVDVSTLQVKTDIYGDGIEAGIDLNSDTISDPNESEGWEAMSAPPADDGRIVNWKHSVANLPQGEHAMWVRVSDVNGTSTETLETRFIIDYGPPDLSITGPVNNSLFNGNFTISGDASDANGLMDVEISFNGGAFSSVMTDPSGTLSTNWSFTGIVPSAGFPDGDYSYQVKATDISGGVTTIDRQLSVDAAAPTLAISEPSTGAIVNGGTVQIRGTADDNRSIVGIYVDLNPNGNSPEADHTLWDYAATGTYSWSQIIDSFSPDVTTLDVGESGSENWVISVKAVDSAGNISSEYTRSIVIDQESDRPVIDFNDIDKAEIDPTNNVLVGATNLTGIIEDDDLIDPSLFAGDAIEISIDGGAWEPVSDPPATSGKVVVWKHDISGLTEGVHTVKLRTRDNVSVGTVGNSSTSPEYGSDFNWNIEDSSDQNGVPFIMNLGPPSIVISGPANYSYHNNDVTISGTATDANDVASVEVSFDNGSNWADLGVTVGSPVAWTHTLTVPPTADGTYSYLVRATDTYGSTGLENGQFTIDASKPEVVINQPSSGDTVNGILTVSGTASDNISLNTVSYDIRPTSDSPPTLGDYVDFTGNYAWTTDFDTTSIIVPTSYTLRVIATDAAGNVSDIYSTAFTVDQSTDKPVINFSSISDIGTFAENLLPGSKQIAGTIIDDDGIEANTIDYRLYEDDGTTEITAGWTAITGRPAINSTLATWTHTFGAAVSDGQYYLELRAADTNDGGAFDGSYDWSSTAQIPFSVDTANPTTTITSPATNGGYTNTDFTVSGDAYDGGGIKTIEITYPTGTVTVLPDSGGPYNTDEAWSHTFDVDETLHTHDGVLSYTVSITDAYDKVFTLDRYINVDTQAPTAAITTPGDGSTVNGTIDVRGTSGDGVLVSSVYLAEGTSLPPNPAADITLDGNYTALAGTTSWTHSLVTTDINDMAVDSDYYITVVAVDVAGNVSSRQDIALVINQESDKPVIEYTSLNDAGTFTDNLIPASKQITGTISDDDGVNAASIQFRLLNEAGDTVLTDWTAVSNPPSSNSTVVTWIHTFDGTVSDGRYQVEIRASDIEDLGLYDGSWDWTATPAVPFSHDTGAPAVAISDMDIADPYSAASINRTASAGMLVHNSFLVRGTATDGNIVSTVEISTDGTTYSAVDTHATPNWSHTVPVNRITHLDDGTLTLYVKATDEFNKSTIISLPLNIDTVEPVVTPTQPAGITDLVNPPSVNGPTTIRGTVTETSAIDTFTATGGKNLVALTNTGTDIAWAFTIDTDLYKNSSDSTETPASSNIWRFPIDMTVLDAAGNRTLENYAVDIDPEGDKPVLYLTAPSADSSVAGAFIVQGTVTDDDDIQKVTIQVDLDYDGLYDSAYNLNSGEDSDTADPFEDESAAVDIAVTNGSWNILMNDSNEFNKNNLITAGLAGADGWIGLRVIPYDNDPSRSGAANLAGDPVDIRIYVDSTLPIIEGQSGALPEPAAGSIVSGTVNLLARVKDDSSLDTSRIQISYDGGQSFVSIESEGGTITPLVYTPGDDYYEYDVSLDIDTTTGGGIVTDGNGVLQTMIRVTDETFKQNSMALQLNVDNTLPTGTWNYNSSLIDTAGLYTFYGNESEGGDYLLIGSVEDTGTISGIEKVEAYLVKNGNFYSPHDSGHADYLAPTAIVNQSISDMAGTPQSIPYPADSRYMITVDNRAERGLYDTDLSDGDNDGFQESLRSKGTYDEWFVYFDSTVFLDGPTDLYYVVHDTAGNMAYELVSAQISNNPPTIDILTIGGTNGTANPIYLKATGNLSVEMDVSDVEDIDDASYLMTVTHEYEAGGDGYPGTANSFTPVVYNAGTFAIDTGTDTGTVSLDTNALADKWHRVEVEIRDSDGNIVTKDFYVLVDNNDTTGPVVTIDPFSQSHATASGHLETAAESPDADSEADLSGIITVTGTARDGNSVNSVTLEISQNGGVSYSDIGTATLSSDSDGDPLNGTEYTWSYAWDTSTITGVADTDIILRAYGHDGTTETAEIDRPEETVDVVPYITGITGTGFDTGLLTYVRRSAAGNYPIVVGSQITITGYNLAGTTAGAFSIGGTPLTASPGSVTSMTVNLGATQTSGDIVVTTSGVASSNNLNDNTLIQNQEPNAYNPNLKDDRVGKFWDVSSITGTSSVTDPYMHPDSAGTNYDWMYVTGGKDLYLRPGNTGTATKLTGGTGLKGGSFNYNDSGSLIYLFNHNAQWSFYANTYTYAGSVQYGLVPDISTFSFTEESDEAYNWNINQTFPKLSLGSVAFGYTTASNDGSYIPAGDLPYPYSGLDLNRYENLKVRSIGTNALTRNYVAYFDSGANESRSIVFFGFQVGTDSAQVTATQQVYSNNANSPALEDDAILGSTGYFANIDKYVNKGDELNTNVSLTGNAKDNNNGIATPRGRQEVTVVNSEADSEDFDLAVYEAAPTTHYGFIAYFDETARALRITANESLFNADPTGTLGTWTTPFTVESNAGADVAIAADPDGGIHLAYQDDAGYMKYSYLTYNAGTDTFSVGKQVYVDALFGAGVNNSIAIRDFGGGDYRPVILTFSSAYTGTIAPLRMSYPLYGLGDGSFGAGADSTTGAFLGNWETIALPAGSNPESIKSFLYVDGSGDVQVGYKGSNLEEADFLGF